MDEIIREAFMRHLKSVFPQLWQDVEDKPVMMRWELEMFRAGWEAREERTDLSIEKYAKRFAGGKDVH